MTDRMTVRNRRWPHGGAALVVSGLILAGCQSEPLPSEEAEGKAPYLGAPTDVQLRRQEGRRAYQVYCAGCHGMEGAGDGSGGALLDPPPCDFSRADMRFSSRGKNHLPTDDDLRRILARGLHRSAMSAFDRLPRATVDALIEHLRAFSTRWEQADLAPVIPRWPDPFDAADGEDAAVALGRRIYHQQARCWICHPSYLDRGSLRTLLAEAEVPRLREHLDMPVRKDDGRGGVVDPPDFLRDRPRVGSQGDDLYRVIAGGVGLTPMPRWHEVFVEAPPNGAEDHAQGSPPPSAAALWALVHYVRYLAQQRPDLFPPDVVIRDQPRVMRSTEPAEQDVLADDIWNGDVFDVADDGNAEGQP